MSVDWDTDLSIPEKYDAPEWVKNRPHVPTHRVKLAHLPTPVQRWNLPGIPQGYKVYIKRDDLTGSALSGSKIRKLEFILAEAVKQGCKHVITVGTGTSNHCRTTAVAAAQVGLKCHLMLASDIKKVTESSCEGNMYLNQMSGTNMYFLPMDWKNRRGIWQPQFDLAKRIEAETGDKSYILPVGGSDTAGLFGYVEAYRELMAQGMLDNVTDIAVGCGSGGTMAGIALANHLATNSKLGLHAILIRNTIDTFHEHCNAELKKLGVNIRSEDLVNCVDTYIGPGYRQTTQENLAFIKEAGKATGIMLDPVYTGKAARGLVQELKLNPQNFKGNNILFIHTGGLFCGMDHEEHLTSLRTDPRGDHYIWKSDVTNNTN